MDKRFFSPLDKPNRWKEQFASLGLFVWWLFMSYGTFKVFPTLNWYLGMTVIDVVFVLSVLHFGLHDAERRFLLKTSYKSGYTWIVGLMCTFVIFLISVLLLIIMYMIGLVTISNPADGAVIQESQALWDNVWLYTFFVLGHPLFMAFLTHYLVQVQFLQKLPVWVNMVLVGLFYGFLYHAVVPILALFYGMLGVVATFVFVWTGFNLRVVFLIYILFHVTLVLPVVYAWVILALGFGCLWYFVKLGRNQHKQSKIEK